MDPESDHVGVERAGLHDAFSLGPERRTADTGLYDIRANFCNLRDARNRVIFTPFAFSLPPAERADWYARQIAAGSTFMPLSPRYSYGGSPIPGGDVLNQPAVFRSWVEDVLAQTAADGRALTPIVFLDDGAANPRERIDAYWPGLIDALSDVLPNLLICPGWELIKASDWTSADYSYALQKLHDLGVVELVAHFSKDRAVGSSNPIEPDDPWQGAERDFYYTHGGEFIKGLLYQAAEDGMPSCDPASADCWLNRWTDVFIRVCGGVNGWRVMPLCLFETVADTYYTGGVDDAFARAVATAGRDLARQSGYSVGFGNGLPE